MVLYRLQIDAIMRDQATSLAVFQQLQALAPEYLAVGRAGCLFEPSSAKIVTSSQDTDHVSDLSITDPAILAELWAFLKEKHPELDPALQDNGIAPSSMKLHDCYHDTDPPQPCVISQSFEVTPEMAVAMNLPVLGSVVSSGTTPQIINAAFVQQVEAAQAAEPATAPTETLADQMAAESVSSLTKEATKL